MREHIVRNVFLIAIAAMPPSLVNAQVADGECSARVVLSSQSFDSAVDVKASVSGAGRIYLPNWIPKGLRIERAENAVVGDGPLPPSSSQVRAESIDKLDATEVDISRKSLVPIQWRDVGEAADGHGFSVPAGMYRARLVYAAVAPRQQRGPFVSLCTVYSAVFTLAQPSEWTANIGDEQPHDPLSASHPVVSALAQGGERSASRRSAERGR